MSKKHKITQKNDVQQRVIFVFDDTPSTEKDYEEFVVNYTALLHRWNRRQGNPIA